MIPKIIHYCWFGGNEKSALIKRCIESWQKFCPDYEIKEWGESTFDLASAPVYVREAYEAKKWAFVTDYVRLYALDSEGGIYLDTDVEVYKSFDDLLDNVSFLGFESSEHIATCVIGAQSGTKWIKNFISHYDDKRFINPDGSLNTVTNVKVLTEILSQNGITINGKQQKRDELTIYPVDYFNPYDDTTGKMNKTKNTYSVHWYAKSWIPLHLRVRSKITQTFHRMFGVDCFKKIKRR